MLKFDKLNDIIKEIVNYKKEQLKSAFDAIRLLRTLLCKINPEDFASTQKVSFSFAVPQEKPCLTYQESMHKGCYRAIACDGSDTPLIDDFAFPYFVINIGYVYFNYGENHDFKADSTPKFFFKKEDVFAKTENSERLISNEAINSLMLLEESKSLAYLIKSLDLNKPSIAMVDGPLTQWGVREKSDLTKRSFLGEYSAVFEEARVKGIPVVGYVSGSKSKDLIGMIRYWLTVCSKDFPWSDVVLTDNDLMQGFLKPGHRTVLFRNTEPFLEFYSEPIYFYYLNNGYEIARIEVPKYVAEDNSLIRLANSLILNQVEKGQGYPVVLKEAHEQAIIHRNEILAFETVIEEILKRENIPFLSNQKNISKRIRTI